MTELSTHAKALEDMRAKGFGERGTPESQIDRRRALEGVVSVETDGADAVVPVMYGNQVSIGDFVRHYRERWTGLATARVVGFEIDDSGDFRYPWVKVLVERIDVRGNPTGKVDPLDKDRWDWDRTETASILDF